MQSVMEESNLILHRIGTEDLRRHGARRELGHREEQERRREKGDDELADAPEEEADHRCPRASLFPFSRWREDCRGNSSKYARPSWFPLLPLAGEGGRRPDEGVRSAPAEPQA